VLPPLYIYPLADPPPSPLPPPCQVRSAVRNCSSVFHLGALVPYNLPRAYSRAALQRVNVDGTRLLVEAAREAGVRSFLICSSTGVVFRGADIAGGDEESLSAAGPWNDAYSESKALAEQCVLAASSVDGMACVALRPNGILGVGEAHHTPKLLLTARLGLAPFMAIAPDILTDFTARANLVEAFFTAHARLEGSPAERARVAGQAFFLTDGWPAHTLEGFSPLLSALGFAVPFPSLIVPRGTNGHVKDCRIPLAELRQIEAKLRSGGGWEEENAAAAAAAAAANSSTSLTAPLLSAGSGGARGRAGSASSPSSRPRSSVSAARPLSTGAGAAPSPPPSADEIILTAPATYPLPGFLLYPAAALLEGVSLLLRPVLNFEPFLTLADVRKVVVHNYYVSDKAKAVLGYTPVHTSLAPVIREMTAFYRSRGYDGTVVSPGWVPWLVAPPGILLTGLLGADVGGVLSSALFPAIARAGDGSGAAALTAVCDALSTVGFRGAAPYGAVADLLVVVCLAAVLCHALQGLWVFALAWPRFLAAGAWGWQSFWLGFPSTSLFYTHARLGVSEAAVKRACVLGFMLCVPLVLGLRKLVELAEEAAGGRG
jgi:nucleoside-diphosphate-sugar epimerase